MVTATVFIDGQAGTTGLELAARLSVHPGIALLEIDEQHRKDPAARRDLMQQAEVTVLCLPDDAVAEAVQLAGEQRLLDASSRHRTDPLWVYGLPELGRAQRGQIAEATRVSNPGCYPQGFILLIRPLIEAGWLNPSVLLTLHALSGYSGGGRNLIDRYQAAHQESPGRVIAPRPYALDQGHKHLPEMRAFSGLDQPPAFSPIVGDHHQGMLVQIPLHRQLLTAPTEAEDDLRAALEQLYVDRYQGERLISVRPLASTDPREQGFLDPEVLNALDTLELSVFGNADHLLLSARLDNLGKGAAGAAVQNLNLMLGFEETTALRLGHV